MATPVWWCPASAVGGCDQSRGPPSEMACTRLGHAVPSHWARPRCRVKNCDNDSSQRTAAVSSTRSRYGRCGVDGHGGAGQSGFSPALVLRILGPLEAWLGDKQVALGGRRQRSVLACLLLEP